MAEIVRKLPVATDDRNFYYLIMHLVLYKLLSSNSPLVYKVAVDVEDGQHSQA
jgi:hypothetical protein